MTSPESRLIEAVSPEVEARIRAALRREEALIQVQADMEAEGRAFGCRWLAASSRRIVVVDEP